MFSRIKMEECMEPERSGIFWAKIVAKIYCFGPQEPNLCIWELMECTKDELQYDGKAVTKLISDVLL